MDVGPEDRFVVVWSANATGIEGQRFDKDGTRIGGVFTIASQPPGVYLSSPDVSIGPDGTMAVAWFQGSLEGDSQIRARRFAADGSPLGPEQMVSAIAGDPQIELGPDGKFVVVWVHNDTESFKEDVWARLMTD